MPSTALIEFENDDIYRPFLAEEFDPQEHASQLVQGVIISEHLNKLTLGIGRLEQEIQNQVGSHYEDLLSQTTGIETLEDVLNTMHGRIKTLQAGVERLRSRVVEPFNYIQKQTLILGRLQATCELLRRVIRCLTLSGKLQEQLSNGPKDITKAATSLSELDELGKDMDLSCLEILEKDQKLIRQARSDIEKQAITMMDKGMETQNQTQVGTALQVFYNLGILVPNVEKVLNNLINRLNKSVSAALNVELLMQMSSDSRKSGGGPGKVMMPAVVQSAQFRANLWAGLDRLMDDIYTICLKTSHLHKVLSKKRDPLSHVYFLEEVYNHSSLDLFSRIWKDVTRTLEEEFSRATKGSNFIKQALEVDYPKLLRLYGDLWKKLEGISNDIIASQNNTFASIELADESFYDTEENKTDEFNPEKALRDSLAPLEKAYISRSLSRLFDGVNIMFTTPDVVPKKEEIDVLMKTITSELNVAAMDKKLSETIARNVVKTLNLFCQKCESLLVTDGEASQVIGPPTVGQTLNLNIVNQLFYVRSQIERTTSATLAHLPPAVGNNLLTILPTIDSLMENSIDPLFASISQAMEAIILTMHNEDFSSNEQVDSEENIQCSLYMKEMQTFTTRIASDYLSPFSHSLVIKDRINKLASVCLDLFLRHISLIRPLGDQGKLRLAADFAQMELCLTPLVHRPSELGRPYRILRAFRPFLFQTPEHIALSPTVGDVMPLSLVLHFLFSKAPVDMKSPHQSAGWSIVRYSNWLDSHPEESDRLQLIQGALEAYVSSVRARHGTEFAPVYPIMLDLLKKGLSKEV